jgi:hypothetical protein
MASGTYEKKSSIDKLVPRYSANSRLLPLASSINSRFQYRGDMRARSKRRSKVSLGAVSFVDNIIAVMVYVVVVGLALSELYRFIQRAVSR